MLFYFSPIIRGYNSLASRGLAVEGFGLLGAFHQIRLYLLLTRHIHTRFSGRYGLLVGM